MGLVERMRRWAVWRQPTKPKDRLLRLVRCIPSPSSPDRLRRLFLTACTFASVFRIGQATGNTRAARPCKIQKLGSIADLDNLNLDKAALFASCPFNWPRLYALKTHVHSCGRC